MPRSHAAALAVLMLAACSEAETPATLAPPEPEPPFRGSPAGAWSRPRLELFIATPEDVTGLEGCIAATIATDGERTAERMAAVERVCRDEAPKAQTDACRWWATRAALIANKFAAFNRSGASNVGLFVLQEAQKDDEPAAVACNASLKQPSDPNTPSTDG